MTVGDLPKAISSVLASLLLQFFVFRIIVIPEKTEEEFNAILITEDEDKIKEG